MATDINEYRKKKEMVALCKEAGEFMDKHDADRHYLFPGNPFYEVFEDEVRKMLGLPPIK